MKKSKKQTALFQGEKVDACAKPKAKEQVEVLRRELDKTIYAFRCKECGGAWKIYQNRYHTKNCSQR